MNLLLLYTKYNMVNKKYRKYINEISLHKSQKKNPNLLNYETLEIIGIIIIII